MAYINHFQWLLGCRCHNYEGYRQWKKVTVPAVKQQLLVNSFFAIGCQSGLTIVASKKFGSYSQGIGFYKPICATGFQIAFNLFLFFIRLMPMLRLARFMLYPSENTKNLVVTASDYAKTYN